jgi:transcriptional regulator GlxA family with amidase domain
MSRVVLILLFEGVQSLDVTGPLEVFAAGRQVSSSGRRYRVITASLGGEAVRTGSGLLICPDMDLRDAPRAHTVIVPGGGDTRAGHPGLVTWLRENAGRCSRIVSVCTGAFMLAQAGLLSGRRATTHWAYCDELAERFPDVAVDPDPIFIRDGKVSTSAGVTSGIDLALALVEEDHGRDVALTIARYLVMYLRRPGNQTQFSAQLTAQSAERRQLRDVQQWVSEHPGADLTVEALAERANLSPRQFARVFAAETGMTPGKYVDRVRLETARRLLEDTDAAVAKVAQDCGYGTPETMRRAFIRALGVPPAEYRRRFWPTGRIPCE